MPGCQVNGAPKKSDHIAYVRFSTTYNSPASNSTVPGSNKPPVPVQPGITKCDPPSGISTCSKANPLALGSFEKILTRLPDLAVSARLSGAPDWMVEGESDCIVILLSRTRPLSRDTSRDVRAFQTFVPLRVDLDVPRLALGAQRVGIDFFVRLRQMNFVRLRKFTDLIFHQLQMASVDWADLG